MRDSYFGLSLGNCGETIDLRRAAWVLPRWEYNTFESDCAGRYLRSAVLPLTDGLEGYDDRLAYLGRNLLPIVRSIQGHGRALRR